MIVDNLLVSMTSWKERISNVPIVVDSIYEGDCIPEKLILNLSSDEFKKKEDDLPIDVLELTDKYPFEIYWVKKNTLSFKKIIPTLNRFPEKLVIGIDDDFIYPTNFVKLLYKNYLNNPNSPLSGNHIKIGPLQCHCGCGSLVKREFYGDYMDMLLDDNLIFNGGADDIFYTYCAFLNDYRYSELPDDISFFNNMKSYNPISSMSGRGAYSNNRTFKILTSKINKPII